MRLAAQRGTAAVGMGPNNIKMLRTRRGLSQVEFAQLAGMTVETLSRLENDRGPMPRATSVRKVAETLGVAPLALWLTPEDALAAVHAVADGRVAVEPEEEPVSSPPAGATQPSPAPAPAAPAPAPGAQPPAVAAVPVPVVQPAPPPPRVPVRADRAAARQSAAVAYGVTPPGAGGGPAEPRRSLNLPEAPREITAHVRRAALEELFPQLPTDIDDGDQIPAGVEAIAQWISENSDDGAVAAPVLRWLVFAWLARVVAADAIRAGATDPIDRADVATPPRSLILAYDHADQHIEMLTEESA
ncbi:MAG: helix-turn-helix domain-containing protein [Chloroflexi bacterium]|nr:helix-turn-helix domain-containing protein [Chloroflexota bacterium]